MRLKNHLPVHHPQIAREVRQGQRPVVPPRDQLPTADAADSEFPGVITYIRLMR